MRNTATERRILNAFAVFSPGFVSNGKKEIKLDINLRVLFAVYALCLLHLNLLELLFARRF